VDPKFNHVEPFSFMLGAGMVIKGWDEGVLGMKVGEKRHLVIPAELAYGSRSPSPLIPANSVLEFDVEMVAINGAN
jgi:FKBP-type peptidyl-prolyl cis-trans isomerase